ncbi:TMEM67 [Lepeophtheirus salmonis]|uniref:TMEM67 n=1 Tax=Lepeophtheirus salmonis TaxID=72036 RepID=A0A7R8H2W7_LEPSM|nr:TMEM67 [Lepeophtheirus salmonis]CAF2833578.1 TMEM67 [Lepeophtheirus salmonis]
MERYQVWIKLHCRPCQGLIDFDNQRCFCGFDEILVERDISGALLDVFNCVRCAVGTYPSSDRRNCVPCNSFPILPNQNCSCNVPNSICYDDKLTGYAQTLENGKRKLKETVYLCEEFNTANACQTLGNLCTLVLHNRNHPACKVIYDLKRSRKHDVPQLYFIDRPDKKKDITNVYRPQSRIQISVAEFDIEGRLISFRKSISGSDFNFCNGSFNEFDAALNFGTKFEMGVKIDSTTCTFPINTSIMDTESTKLFGLPILLKNLEQNQNKRDGHNLQFITRFFMMDRIGGVASESEDESIPEAIRFLKKFHLKIQLLDTREYPQLSGTIYPPLIEIEYGVITREELEEARKNNLEGSGFTFEFKIDYSMDIRESIKDIEISIGVLSAIAVFWSVVQTWTWSRRSGKMTIDPFTLIEFLANACGNLAHVFFIVIYFASLYYMIFFKQQNYIYVILPDEDQEKIIKNFIYSIFALKIIDILHLIYQQMMVDIFLVDWEKPHPSSEKTKELPVSVWRTYLVANEWNELQTTRKISISLQIFMILIILKVFYNLYNIRNLRLLNNKSFVFKICGVENVGTSDPQSSFTLSDGEYHSNFSFVCRFALSVSVYGSVALVQVAFWRGIYTSLIEDKLEQFLDICSLANISVFVMSLKNFGYYIHGKSAHGISDTDMGQMLEHLQRETEDLCGHRGLQTGSDHQTFTMTLPAKLQQAPQKIISGNAATLTKAYDTMNKFLNRFLEHALRDIDYEIRDRIFLEQVIDTEFQDSISFQGILVKSLNDIILRGLDPFFDNMRLDGFNIWISEELVFTPINKQQK